MLGKLGERYAEGRGILTALLTVFPDQTAVSEDASRIWNKPLPDVDLALAEKGAYNSVMLT